MKNIVFMGMGEPMDNLDVVFEVIEIMVDMNGSSILTSNIIVSMVG